MTNGFWVELRLSGLRGLVIGSDREAYDKALCIAESGATVTVIAPRNDHRESNERARAEHPLVTVFRREYSDDDLVPTPAVVVVGAGQDALCEALWNIARDRGFLLCCLDRPRWCHWVNVSQFEVGALKVGVGSSGQAPGLVKRLREDLALGLEGALEEFSRYVSEVRRRASPKVRRQRVTEALEGFKVNVEVQLPDAWRDRWKAINQQTTERGVIAQSNAANSGETERDC